MDVPLGYLNYMAYGQEMKLVFQYGFYVGTFEESDLGAIEQALR